MHSRMSVRTCDVAAGGDLTKVTITTEQQCRFQALMAPLFLFCFSLFVSSLDVNCSHFYNCEFAKEYKGESVIKEKRKNNLKPSYTHMKIKTVFTFSERTQPNIVSMSTSLETKKKNPESPFFSSQLNRTIVLCECTLTKKTP